MRSALKKPPVNPTRYIERIMRWRTQTHGNGAKLVRRMEELCGHPINRQEVESWLHEDPAKRVEPRLGNGMLLIVAFESLQEAQCKPRKK